jgi:hypothetical protein
VGFCCARYEAGDRVKDWKTWLNIERRADRVNTMLDFFSAHNECGFGIDIALSMSDGDKPEAGIFAILRGGEESNISPY